jgi:hypothetical protein
LRIEGLVIGGGGARAILLMPDVEQNLTADVRKLSLEEWSDFIRRTDDPEILVGPRYGTEATMPKIFHRKIRFQISGHVQQRVWAADGFKCMYCGAPMGKALMTIDHFIPLELGGTNDIKNYLTACKSCNKDKGSQDPEKWIAGKLRSVDFLYLRDYLEKRKI